MTIYKMIVYHSRSLHMRINNCGTHKFKPSFFIFKELIVQNFKKKIKIE